jgi:hypothetical protein
VDKDVKKEALWKKAYATLLSKKKAKAIIKTNFITYLSLAIRTNAPSSYYI